MSLREKVLPVYIMRDDGVTENQISAVKAGITELLQIANMSDSIEIYDFGDWKHSQWNDNGNLMPYGSIDWYLERGIVQDRNQLDAGAILGAICREPWQNTTPHYDVVVTSCDMYSLGTNFVLGLAYPGSGTVISTARWQNFSDTDQFKLIKTQTMHEFGHVLGLPNGNRSDIEQKLGGHCLKECVMRQGMQVPIDWVSFTNDWIKSGRPLCPTCEKDLRNFFR